MTTKTIEERKQRILAKIAEMKASGGEKTERASLTNSSVKISSMETSC